MDDQLTKKMALIALWIIAFQFISLNCNLVTIGNRLKDIRVVIDYKK